MKYTVVGDPHLQHSNIELMAQLCAEVEKLELPVIWLGDMLHSKEVIRGKCLNFWIEYFSKSKLKHIVLVGNHDYYNLECQDHALQALKFLKNVEIIDTLIERDGLFFIPYMHSTEQIKATLKAIPSSSTLFAHLDVQEFDYGNGFICENGIKLSDLKKFKHVISGHFHKYQTKKNLTYLGTPFSHSFGEANQDKHYAIFDTETSRLQLVPTGLPRHIDIEVDCNKVNKIDDALLQVYGNSEDLYRVILTGSEEATDSCARLTSNEFKVKYISKPSVKQENTTSIQETSSNASQFSTWASDIEQLDPETIKLGLEIMEAVQ